MSSVHIKSINTSISCVVRPLYKMPSLSLHNSYSVDIFILCQSFISSVYELFEINVLKSLRHNVDGMLYLYIIYL